MARPVLLCLLLAVYFSEARVNFNYSQIYDEYDFEGKTSVTVEGLCKDTCHIYASITEEWRKVASNILIQTPKGFTRLVIAALSDMRNSANGQKMSLEISNTPSLKITNNNAGQIAGPLVLYIVNKHAPNFADAEVYEAKDLHRSSSIVRAVTVMSARPFTLKQAKVEGAKAAQGVIAQLTGFDALLAGTDPCPNLYSLVSAPFPGFEMQINAPIVSLLYDIVQYPAPAGELSATIGISNVHQLERSGFFNSPGFHGCAGYNVYRSSLYNYRTPTRVELMNATPLNIVLQFVASADKLHPVRISDPEHRIVDMVTETNPDEPKTFKYFSQNVIVTWEQDGMYDYHYMARYNSTVV